MILSEGGQGLHHVFISVSAFHQPSHCLAFQLKETLREIWANVCLRVHKMRITQLSGFNITDSAVTGLSLFLLTGHHHIRQKAARLRWCAAANVAFLKAESIRELPHS